MSDRKWQSIHYCENEGDLIDRMWVFQGWIVRNTVYYPNKQISITFVPDPHHKWDGKVGHEQL